MKNTQKFSILLWLNKQRAKNEEFPIYVRISIDGKRAEIATKHFLNPKFWNSVSAEVKNSHPNSNHYNTLLPTLNPN